MSNSDIIIKEAVPDILCAFHSAFVFVVIALGYLFVLLS